MSITRRLPAGARRVLRLKVVLATYLLAAALMPLAHHDVICHAKSTTHCATCIIGSSAEAAADPAHLTRFGLRRVGDAVCAHSATFVSTALSICSGRAPPADLV